MNVEAKVILQIICHTPVQEVQAPSLHYTIEAIQHQRFTVLYGTAWDFEVILTKV